MSSITFPIKGMHCASCAVRIEGTLQKTPGVQSASVNFALNQATVDFDSAKVTEHDLHEAVRKEGYEPVMPESHSSHSAGHDGNDHSAHLAQGDVAEAKWKTMQAFLFAIPALLLVITGVRISGSAFGVPTEAWALAVLSTIVVLGPGFEFHRTAFRLTRRFAANMDTLISLGTLAALALSWWQMFLGGDLYFETAAIIAAFILLGRYFEAVSKGKASEAIGKLLALGAKTAHRLKADGSLEEVAIESLKIGDRVRIKPGEKVPLDGVVREGDSSLDESMLTGESMPISKHIGDLVFGATINAEGTLLVEITKESGQTVLAQIVRLVSEAQTKKAPIQKLADRISGVFVPIVIVLSVLTFLGWIFIGASVPISLIYAVAVLVIACPCALGLATPTAILVGTGHGARRGILIKNGEALERGRSLDVVIFDKTGTLTEGKPAVTDIKTDGASEEDALAIAGGLETFSEHPLAKAVVTSAAGRGITLSSVSAFRSITGKGVEGKIVDELVRVGKIEWMRELGISAELFRSDIDAWQKQGKTVVAVARGAKAIAVLAIADTTKPHAKHAVQEIESLGLSVVMLTGDHTVTAQAIANELGIREVIAEVLPDQKLEVVRSWQAKGKHVAFVGDGINDAPALTQADLGIAVGSGTDIAIEAGQIVLVGGGPEKVPEAIRLARRTYRTIMQNLFWAFIYNVVGIPLAMLGLLNPIIAGGAMAFSSVSVVLNALRLRK